MTNPKRWIDDGAPDPVRELLIAASEELPERRSAERALAALGVAGALSANASAGVAPAAGAAASMTAGAKSALGSSAITLALKWGLVGVASAVATVGMATVVQRTAALSATTAPSHVSGRAPTVQTLTESRNTPTEATRAGTTSSEARTEGVPREVATSQPSSVPAMVTAPRTAARPANGVAPASIAAPDGVTAEHGAGEMHQDTTSAMAEEVAMIDRARAAVARGDAATAIAALDLYASRFEVRRFDPEALYLRMEALGRSGDLEGQRRAATRLLATFPNAPQSARARAVLR